MSSVLPFAVGMSTANFGGALQVSMVLSVIWFVASAYAIRRFRKLGWWTMLGLIPALFWLCWLVAVAVACAESHVCL